MDGDLQLEEWLAKYLSLRADYGDFDDTHSVLIDVNSDVLDDSDIEDQILRAASKIQVSQGFCTLCQDLCNHWPDLEKKNWAHAVARPCRTAEIESAARQGCKFCAFLLQRLKAEGALDTFRKIERRLQRLGNDSTASISVCNWGTGKDGTMSQIIWLNFPGKVSENCNSWPSQQTEFESHVVQPSFYVPNLTDQFDIAKQWLHTCSESHELCSAEMGLERPTRLLHIGDDAVNLVKTADLDTMHEYATLSYCWGTTDFFKLKPDTFDVLSTGVSEQVLPSTFRDAIVIARKLAIHYIWIDALCIIQGDDDHRDWRRESGLMRSIYGGSHLNIAAADCKSVHDSLFATLTNHCDGLYARIQTKDTGRVQSFHTHEVYEDSTSEIHLSTRAWALQEKLLAPRTIYFGNRGLFWECRTKIASGSMTSGFPGKLGSHLVRPPKEAFDWRAIVRNYSGAALTHVGDKLPALSGVARRHHEATGDTYLAGMWSKKLVKQLGWQSFADEKTARPPWRAPSWSWASVDGPVYLWSYWDSAGERGPAKIEYVEVVDVSTAAAGQDPFGAIVGAELRLACTALVHGLYQAPVQVDSGPSDEAAKHFVVVGHDASRLPVSMDCSVDDSLKNGDSLYLLPLFGGESGMGRMRKSAKTKSENTGNPDEQLNKFNEEDCDEELVIRGMLMQRMESPKGSFQRIGSFSFLYRPWEDSHEDAKAYDTFMLTMRDQGSSTAESVCSSIRGNEEDSKARYVIELV